MLSEFEIKQSNDILKKDLESWEGSNMSELIATECQMRLLHVTCVYCNFPEAETIYREMLSKVPIPTGILSLLICILSFRQLNLIALIKLKTCTSNA